VSFALRIAIIGLATFAATGMLSVALVPWASRRINEDGAAARARRLAALRLLPAALALAAATVVVLSFVFFEPYQPEERIGTVFSILAIVSVGLLTGAAWRWARITLATRRLIRQWSATASPLAIEGVTVPAFAVTADFPIVAVAGIARPRLFVARSVLASCTPEELRAILAHEQGHIDRRDNLRRLLLTLAPDVLTWVPSGDRILAAWREASEEAADDDASRLSADERVRLAGALIKIAKLAKPSHVPALIPASTFYCGERLDRRVRRLLDPAIRREPRRQAPWRSRLSVAAALVLCVLTLEGVHTAIEIAIQTLP
jgi:hypothetical protein